MWPPGERVLDGKQVLTKVLCSFLVLFWPLRPRAGQISNFTYNLGGH